MKISKLLLVCCCMALLLTRAYAQQNMPQVQEFYSQVSSQNEFVFFDLFGMNEGTTIYLYAESDEFDTYLELCDIDCVDVFAENDDIDFDADNLNSALSYTFETSGDYSIAVSDCCDAQAVGVFRLLIGFDAPDVLAGTALPTEARIAVPYAPTYTDLNDLAAASESNGGAVQQLYATLDPETPFVAFELTDVRVGETLYLYAESEEIDTYLSLCGWTCETLYAENDDIDYNANNLNSALRYTITEQGDYTIVIEDCCTNNVEGTVRLLISYDDPSVLNGIPTPTGVVLAEDVTYARDVVDLGTQGLTVGCDADVLLERPELSGPMQTRETAHFIIHYTTEGEDATTETYVDEVATALETTYTQQIVEIGWPAPVLDCGGGGDTRYDLYLEEMFTTEGVFGYASPETIIGDNPASEGVETQAATGYMAIDNDYKGYPEPLSAMRATIDHEFHHLVQYGYDISETLSWYYEATASWMETQSHPDDQAVTDYADSVFLEPDLCVGSELDETGLRIYGEWMLIDSLARDYGADAIIDLWEFIAEYDDMDAYYEFLAYLGTGAATVLQRYAIRNLLRDYAVGDDFFETVIVDAAVDNKGTVTPARDGVEQLAVDYVLVRRKGLYQLSVQPAELQLVVVGLLPDGEFAEIVELGAGGVVDTSDYSHAYIIVLNPAEYDDPFDCERTDWQLEVSSATGQTPVMPDSGEFSTAKFVPAG